MSAASDLLSNYQHIIESLTLFTGSRGVFDVVVDGQTLYSKSDNRRHANPGEILALFEERFGNGIGRYGD